MGPLFQFSPYGKDDAAQGIDAKGRPGALFTQAGAHANPEVFKQLGEQHATWQAQRRRTVVAAWTRGSRERLANLLRENGLRAHAAETWQKVRVAPRDHIVLMTLGLERGFIADDIGVIGEQDLLGERISRPAAAPQARRPVHRRSHGDRGGRPGRAPGPRHRPL